MLSVLQFPGIPKPHYPVHPPGILGTLRVSEIPRRPALLSVPGILALLLILPMLAILPILLILPSCRSHQSHRSYRS